MYNSSGAILQRYIDIEIKINNGESESWYRYLEFQYYVRRDEVRHNKLKNNACLPIWCNHNSAARYPTKFMGESSFCDTCKYLFVLSKSDCTVYHRF